MAKVLADMLKQAIKIEDYELAVSTIETLVAIKQQSRGATIFNQDWAYADVARAAAQSGQIVLAKEPYSSNYALALIGVGLQQQQAGRLEASAVTMEQESQWLIFCGNELLLP